MSKIVKKIKEGATNFKVKLKGLSEKQKILLTVIVMGAIGLAGVLIVYNNTKSADVIPLDATEKVGRVEKNKAISNMRGILKEVRNKNGYFNVVDGEDSSQTYVYNNNGEAVAQGSKYNYITVYRNDKKSVRFTDVVEVGYDIDILKLIDNALILADKNEVKINKPKEPLKTNKEENKDEFELYNIEFNGWNEIKKLYTSIDKDFADLMIANMKKSAPSDSDDILLRFRIMTGKEKELSTACEIEMEGKKYTLWYFDGYLLLDDWSMDKNWYTYDFKDGKKADEMLDKLISNLDSMFKEYAKKNNLDISDAEKAKKEGATKGTDTKDKITNENKTDNKEK